MSDHPLASHPYFTPWTDPVSNVVSYILTERVAPVQMVIYFVNPCISNDEKWLWFACGYPPSPLRRLGVVSLDPNNLFIRVFQEATFQFSSPLISDSGDACMFCSENSVYEVNIRGEVRKIVELPAEFLNNRVINRVATHLTKSADNKYLLLDSAFAADRWFVALGEIATGKVEILKEWTHHMNHGQFSPVDPDLFIISQDLWNDQISGQQYMFDKRIWLMDTRRTIYEPIRPKDWFQHGTDTCHEWWDRQGRVCWVDYKRGLFRMDLKTQTLEHMWERPLCHGHCDPTGQYWCCDDFPYRWAQKPVEVAFYDSATRREVKIATALPKPDLPRRPFHVDPHPHFSPKGTYVAYMTTVHNRLDVALTPVASLLKG